MRENNETAGVVPTNAERLAILEAELRNTKHNDEEIKASLERVSESLGVLATSTNVNAAMLKQIQGELRELKKKADFIPNTLLAAAIATAVTFGITTVSGAEPDVDPTAHVQEEAGLTQDSGKEAQDG